MRWVLSVAIILSAQVAAFGQNERLSEREQQNAAFKKWWGEELVWRFEDLPLEGDTPDWRVPYSGHDYPDRQGGTAWALRLYDAAYRTGGRATSWEQWDTTAYKERGSEGRGLLGRLFAGRPRTPHWHGHCNGWTAAAMRHAEPQNSVVRNGVTFSPAAIKALLAEIYMYQDIEYLGGQDYSIDPAIFHVVLTNWLGRGKHPVAMDSTLGKEVWNYPIYSYSGTAHKHRPDFVEVSMNIVYADSTRQEYDESPNKAKQIYFHYQLFLDSRGNITGGRFYRDSNQIDILWAPVAPVASGQEGNERGNPHVNVKEVLAIWRQSVPEELRNKWLNIDPLKEDIATVEDSEAGAAPTQISVDPSTSDSSSSSNAAEETSEGTVSEAAETTNVEGSTESSEVVEAAIEG